MDRAYFYFLLSDCTWFCALDCSCRSLSKKSMASALATKNMSSTEGPCGGPVVSMIIVNAHSDLIGTWRKPSSPMGMQVCFLDAHSKLTSPMVLSVALLCGTSSVQQLLYHSESMCLPFWCCAISYMDISVKPFLHTILVGLKFCMILVLSRICLSYVFYFHVNMSSRPWSSAGGPANGTFVSSVHFQNWYTFKIICISSYLSVHSDKFVLSGTLGPTIYLHAVLNRFLYWVLQFIKIMFLRIILILFSLYDWFTYADAQNKHCRRIMSVDAYSYKSREEQ